MYILASLDRYNQLKALMVWVEMPEREDIQKLLEDLAVKHDAAVFRVYEEQEGIEFAFDSIVEEFHFLDDSDNEDEFEEQVRLGIY